MDKLPIIYIRGFAGPTAGIDSAVDDPFYGFNLGATHIRVGGDAEPTFYQFEGPLLRLMTDEQYQVLVHGDQQAYLDDDSGGDLPKESIWIYRFYDQAATTFAKPAHAGVVAGVFGRLHREVTADGFDIEQAAAGLYRLIERVLARTGAPKVFLVAHSMGGLVARCMMQKLCGRDGRAAAPDVVAKLFTYGTPHGGIAFDVGALNWIERTFGPAGSGIFAPEKMYGYLTPGRTFGDEPPRGANWDPREMAGAFPPGDVFCLIGTDPADYSIAKVAVGPRSDGLVRIENAYVQGAHRAFVYKSHSGRYGEVNSEEGYQNLRRFLFGRWAATAYLDGLAGDVRGAVWQADMRLAIRGLPVVMSEQLAAHWCPIQINAELERHTDSPDAPVPLVGTFLLDRGGPIRYTLTLRVYKLKEVNGAVQFRGHLEQVPDWEDSLIVDVLPRAGAGPAAYAAWTSRIPGPNDEYDPVAANATELALAASGNTRTGHVDLPDMARTLPVLGPNARLTLQVTDRSAN